MSWLLALELPPLALLAGDESEEDCAACVSEAAEPL